MPDVHHQDVPYPPSWKDPAGLTHPVVKLEGGAYVVDVAACHESKLIWPDEVVFDQPTTCLVCAIVSKH